jgi:hypothetical protein
MKNQIRHRYRASLVVLAAACSRLEAGTVPAVPAGLEVPAGQTLALEAFAAGVQIYDCKQSSDDPARYEFVFRAPEADLFDQEGQKIGKHYAGPTWESNDGSKVTATVKARADAPNVNAIPWLLLGTSTASGAGALAKDAEHPARADDRRQRARRRLHAGTGRKEMRMPYQAMYYFYVAGNDH